MANDPHDTPSRIYRLDWEAALDVLAGTDASDGLGALAALLGTERDTRAIIEAMKPREAAQVASRERFDDSARSPGQPGLTRAALDAVLTEPHAITLAQLQALTGYIAASRETYGAIPLALVQGAADDPSLVGKLVVPCA